MLSNGSSPLPSAGALAGRSSVIGGGTTGEAATGAAAAFSAAPVNSPCGLSLTEIGRTAPETVAAAPDAASAGAVPEGASSKPVAMTVTRISSCSEASNVAQKMMLASGCAASCTRFAAVSTSSRSISSEPVMLISTPRAPFMDVSISGLATASFAASSALPLPAA